MNRKEFFTVTTPEEARRVLLESLQPLRDSEVLPTERSAGRVLAREVVAPGPMPAFPRSTMDGYAVRAADTFGASPSLPAYLQVVGEILMGSPATRALGGGEAILTHTGGMIPPGADSVVMVENTQTSSDHEIEILKPVAVGENVLQVGEDIAAGAAILPAGHRLRPQDVGGLLGLGVTAIVAARRPRVTVFSTGAEVIPPKQRAGPGQVRDINSYMVGVQTERAGGIPLLKGILPDDLDVLTRECRKALDEADMLVLSGGSSVSIRDLTAKVFAQLGSPGILVHGIAIKPGKPTLLAVADGKPCIGLPGNPASSFILYELVGVPALLGLQGASSEPRRGTVRARLAKSVPSVAGREDYIPTRLTDRGGQVWAEPAFGKSNLIFRLVEADGLLRVPLNSTGLEAGERVEVQPF